MENIFKTRIQSKFDYLSTWEQHGDFTPLKGEIIIAYVPSLPLSSNSVSNPEFFIKVGNGENAISSLQWITANAGDVWEWAKKQYLDWNDLDFDFLSNFHGEVSACLSVLSNYVQWDEKHSLTIGSRTKEYEYGENSLVNGISCHAPGYNSHAEGCLTEAHGESSHAEGYLTKAYGKNSHAEGVSAIVSAGHFSAFAWQGSEGKYDEKNNPYYSHGSGTFNIKPVGNLSGFYVGEKSLHGILNELSGNIVNLIMGQLQETIFINCGSATQNLQNL